MSEPPTEGRRIALLFGGRSTEHEVSVVSARNVRSALHAAGEIVVPVGVTAEGRWLAPAASEAILDSDAKVVRGESNAAEVLPDIARGGLWMRNGSRTERLEIDAVFPIIHGAGGEDGKLQSVLELAGLPYAGPGPLASAVCMDKGVAKDLLRAHGLPVTPGKVLRAEELRESGAPRWAARIAEGLRYPLFVKPANGGSSVGIRKVPTEDGLIDAVRHAAEYDDRVLVEQGIDGQEVECALLGNDDVECAILGEIAPPNGFYDYAAKYENDAAELIVPARLPQDRARQVRETALQAYAALRLEGFARIDFLVERGSTKYYINEANTLPGFTEISMFPRLWKASGLEPAALVRKLIDLGVQRYERRDRWVVTNRS